jgi:hypothetical protein
MDHKNKVIFGMSFVILVLLVYMVVASYNDRQTALYNQGVQDGASLQQRNMLQTIQATGFYSVNVVDESGNPLTVVLAPVQPQQASQPRATQ